MEPMTKYREYAHLLITVGLNVQRGQDLVIACPVECAWFARLCAQAAYDAGCREVLLEWRDDALTRLRCLRAADEVFDRCPPWRSELRNHCAAAGAAFLSLSAADPENLKGVDPDRLVRQRRADSAAMASFYRLQMTNGIPWCVAAVPIASWAGKVFPGCGAEEAVEKLWDALLAAVRVTGDGGAPGRWRAHVDTLRQRVETLNRLRLERLHYANSLGTDLTIRLPEGHLWSGGDSVTAAGQRFVANIPTEEIFTAPLRDGVEGVVYASMPLVHNGNIITGIRFTLRGGRIVEARADEGEEQLRAAISLDEGAARLGEVALVPYDSPISRQGILYYNTLFDENASCHLAFGEAYAECVRGGEGMTREELRAAGLNDSITHVDFMVGTPDLSITGYTRDGRKVPVFIDGHFAL